MSVPEPPPAVLIVESERSPFEVYLLVACVLSGLAGLLSPANASSAVARLLPHWAVLVWSAGLLAGGAVALAGVLMRGIRGLLVERVGLSALAGLAVTYSIAVITAGGIRGTFAAVFVASFAVACLIRFRSIGRRLARLTRPRSLGGDDRGTP